MTGKVLGMAAARPDDPTEDSWVRVQVAGADRDTEFTTFMAEAAPALARTAWDRRSGTDEDKVFGMITDLLSYDPGLLPQDLRTALWRAAALLPDVEVTSGTDSTVGRGTSWTTPGTKDRCAWSATR